MARNPNQLSDDDLLKLLNELEDENVKTNQDDSEITFDNSVIAFVQTFNLKPGKHKIIKKQLFKLYNLWNKGITKIDRKKFSTEIGFYLEQTANYYLIDSSLFKIAEYVQEQKYKSKDRTKSKHYRNHFNLFLNETKLEEGTNYIEAEILYFIYQKWRRKTKRTALLTKYHFTRILDLHFDVRILSKNNHPWVGVNDQIKNLITRSEVERWRKTRAKEVKYVYRPAKEFRKVALFWEEAEENKDPET